LFSFPSADLLLEHCDLSQQFLLLQVAGGVAVVTRARWLLGAGRRVQIQGLLQSLGG